MARGSHDQTGPMTVDCGTCPARGVACEGCMVTALLSTSPDHDWSGGHPEHRGPHPRARSAAVLAAGPEEDALAGVGLPLDGREREAISVLVASGLVEAETATRARARREPWSDYRAVAG